eukprot:6486823-Amphidinium_carterae.1
MFKETVSWPQPLRESTVRDTRRNLPTKLVHRYFSLRTSTGLLPIAGLDPFTQNRFLAVKVKHTPAVSLGRIGI